MASAAMLVRYHKVQMSNVIFVSYSGKIFEDAMEFVSNIKGAGNLLVISDFGMAEDNLDKIARILNGFKDRGNRIFWLTIMSGQTPRSNACPEYATS